MKNVALALFAVGAEAYFGCVYSDAACGTVTNCSTIAVNSCIPDIFFGTSYFAYVNCSAAPAWQLTTFSNAACTTATAFPPVSGADANVCADATAARLKINCDAASQPPAAPTTAPTTAPTLAPTTAPTAATTTPSTAASVAAVSAASLGLLFLL